MTDKFKSKIDTVEIRTPISNVADTSVWDSDEKPYIKEGSVAIKPKDGIEYIIAVVHISRTQSRYDDSDNMYKYSTYERIISMVLKDLTVQCHEAVEINRLDVCIDTKETFADMFKISHCITGLYALETKADKVWKNVDLWTDEVNGFNVKKRDRWLCIYDKALESNGNSPYKTRYEFRFMRQGNAKSIDEVRRLGDVVQVLDRLVGNLGAYEEKMADCLYIKYQKQLSKKQIKNFTQFVAQSNEVIATSRMCELLYDKVGLKGTYRNWLRKYRMSNDIDFVSKAELNKVMLGMKKSVKEFKKS